MRKPFKLNELRLKDRTEIITIVNLEIVYSSVNNILTIIIISYRINELLAEKSSDFCFLLLKFYITTSGIGRIGSN